MEDLTGKQLGQYRIVSPLGEGGMAAVYKAYQPAMDRYVALKILPRHFASDPEFVGRFEQEAKVIAKLQHVHILPVHDFGTEDGYTYIVMPFVETGTIAELLHGKPLPLKQIRKIIIQVGDALAYAHTRGLVHRDVKPTNILIDEIGNCLLTDFGIAKIVEGTTKFTQTGAILGTPAYMSPEQIKGEKLDGRSDIYSLGVILYEMATGRPPFRAETPPAIFVKHLHDPLPPPRSLNPSLPEAVERVILKSLTKDPGERYDSANEFVQAVRNAIPEIGPPPPVHEPTAPVLAPTVIEEVDIPAGPPSPAPEAISLSDLGTTERQPKRKVPFWLIGAIAGIGILAVIVVIGGSFLPGVLPPRDTETPVVTDIALPTEVLTIEPTTPIETPVPTVVPVAGIKWTYASPNALIRMDSWGDGLAAGDLNQDGIPEIAIGLDSGDVVILDGVDGVELWSYRLTPETEKSIRADIVDVNNDGLLEVVATSIGDFDSEGRGIVCVLDALGSRIWQSTVDDIEVVDLAYGDIDGDGDTDVVASAGTYPWGGGQVVLFDGATGVRLWETSLGSGHGQGIDVLDVDADGDMEVAVENYDNKVFLLDGLTGSVIWSKSKSWYGRDVEIVDVDGDGVAEIISGAGQVAVYDPSGTLEWTAAQEQEGMFISVGDITGDGWLEVVVSSSFPGLSIALDGQGIELWNRTKSGIHALGDVDGDEVLDVVFATVAWWEVEPPYAVYAVNGSNEVIWMQSLDTIHNAQEIGLAVVNLDSDSAGEVILANGVEIIVFDPSQ
jgi:serine/threonine protein kinase/outer membrane protein assembly factor BamB